MIHLAGISEEEILDRALEEINIYEEEGLSGAIVENYHGKLNNLVRVVEEIGQKETPLVLGINVLGNPYLAFPLTLMSQIKFIQFDSVQDKDLKLEKYHQNRKDYPGISILGGIRFKYQIPTGNSLEQDLEEGKRNCNCIVTTGDGTGIETPLQKLKEFKNYLEDFPLIVGAGINFANVTQQLSVADGAIVGSAFKPYGNTYEKVDRIRVRKIMDEVRTLKS